MTHSCYSVCITKLELQLNHIYISINYHNRWLTNRLPAYRGIYQCVSSQTAIYRSYRYTVQHYAGESDMPVCTQRKDKTAPLKIITICAVVNANCSVLDGTKSTICHSGSDDARKLAKITKLPTANACLGQC